MGIIQNKYSVYMNGKISKKQDCPEPLWLNEKKDKANIQIEGIKVLAMPIAKLNNGLGIGNDADQSELARVFAFKTEVTCFLSLK